MRMVVYSLSQEVLRTDVSGMPLEWIDYRDAVRLHFMGQIAYACGQPLFRLWGGVNARSGRRTSVEVNSIVATLGHSHNPGNLMRDRKSTRLNSSHLVSSYAVFCLKKKT